MNTETKVANFNITEWADEFWSFIDDPSKQGEPLPITSTQELGFCMSDALGMVEGLPEDFGYPIAEKRAEFCGLKCTPGFLVCIASVATSPGDAVMLVHAFRHEQDATVSDALEGATNLLKRGYNADDFFKITNRVTPSKEHLHKMWDAQKGGKGTQVDNWLDQIASEEKFVKAIRNGYVEMPERF